MATPGPAPILDRVVELVHRACDGDPGGMGVVATPGPVDATRGVVRTTSNLPFRDYPLGPLLTRRLGAHVTVVVDTAAAAVAEFLPRGAAAGCRTGVYVTISTGIGMAVVGEGRLQPHARSRGCRDWWRAAAGRRLVRPAARPDW